MGDSAHRIFDIGDGEYHSSDAYYRNVRLVNYTLIIPYINLGIIHHPLNTSSRIQYLDKCYIVFRELKLLELYNKGNVIDLGLASKLTYFFGGLNLDSSSEFIDMEISADAGQLRILPNTLVSDQLWVPIETPNFKANMNPAIVDAFFDSVYSLEV